MAFYSSAEQLYECVGELFARIEQQGPEATKAITKSRLFIRFKCSNPTALITINARTKPIQVSFGDSVLRPELDITLEADTFHGILVGQLSLKKCVANKLVKPKGPIWKTFALVSIFDQGKIIYPQVLKDKGLL